MTDLLSPLGTDAFDWQRSLLALLLAFALGQVVALVYIATFRGLSYARTTVHGLALGSVVTCMLMLAVGNSIAAGIGLAGGLSAVRFRTTLRDPRDIIFVFGALGVGMACGASAPGVAVLGTLVFSAGALLLHHSGYGTRRQPDGLLRFAVPTSPETENEILKILREHCRTFALVTLREAAHGAMMEYAYQVSLLDPELRAPLVKALQAIAGARDVALLLQEPSLEL
jgi:hypothetical protein